MRPIVTRLQGKTSSDMNIMWHLSREQRGTYSCTPLHVAFLILLSNLDYAVTVALICCERGPRIILRLQNDQVTIMRSICLKIGHNLIR